MQKKVLVIGHPISHSLSPKLHGFWLKQYGINGSYEAKDVAPDVFPEFIRNLGQAGYAGANITVPFKEDALRNVDEISPIATRIGAVNTIIVQEDGALYGTNTDAYGFIHNITDHIPHYNFTGRTALVLGAGGAARAVVAALLDAGCTEIRLTNRTKDKAEKLAQDVGGNISTLPWDARNEALKDIDFLVNTTSLGMTGQRPLAIDISTLPTHALVTDIVYNPLITPLLAQAKAQGNQIVDGLGMLLHQAVPGFEAWFGKKPEVSDALRQIILAS